MNAPEPRRGIRKFAHKIRNVRSGKLAKSIRRNAARARGRPVAHFIHIRKAGGTAIKNALRPHASDGPYYLDFHPHRITIDDIPEGEKVFFIIRDPLSRLVSGFLDRERMGAPANNIPWTEAEREAFARFPTIDDLGAALADENAQTRAGALDALRSIRHVNSSYWDWFRDERTLERRAEDVLFIGHQERLADDFTRLRAVLSLPEHVALPTDPSRSNRAGTPASETQLSPEAEAALREYLAPEYRFIEMCETLLADR